MVLKLRSYKNTIWTELKQKMKDCNIQFNKTIKNLLF